jgi:hypothetical protein
MCFEGGWFWKVNLTDWASARDAPAVIPGNRSFPHYLQG